MESQAFSQPPFINPHPFRITYIHCSTFPGPILGISTYVEVHNLVKAMRSLGDPGFSAAPITFLGPSTHTNRMSQMRKAVETATRLIGRPRLYIDYNPAVIAQASANWPNNYPAAVLFACTVGDRRQYQIFRELHEMKVLQYLFEDQVRAIYYSNVMHPGDHESSEKKREIIMGKINKLMIAVSTLEDRAEMIALMKWTETM